MWAGLNRAQQAIIPLQDPLERASEELGEQADSVSSTIDQHIEELTQAATKLRRLVIDRSGGTAELGVPKATLVTLKVQNYDPAECPLCKSGIPAVKPGSRSKK